MGEIKRQSIITSIITYSGVILGFITTAILFSRYLTTDQNGILKLLVSYSAIFAQFSSLGIGNVIIKLFPQFRNKKNNNNDFLFYSVSIVLIGFSGFLLFFLLIRPWLISYHAKGSHVFEIYHYYLMALTFFLLLFNTFDVYYRSLLKSVKGTFLKEFIQRLLIATFTILYIFDIINFRSLVMLYCFAISFPGIFLTTQLLVDKEFSLPRSRGLMSKSMIKQVISIGTFGLITGSANLAIINLDSIMISLIKSTSLTGVYAITSYFGVLVSIPSRNFLKIGAPVISQAMKDQDLGKVRDVYYRSCLTQFIIGIILTLGLVTNLDNIVFHILKEEFIEGKYVILFMGLANLVIMAGGVNSMVIANSSYYKYMAYITIFLFIAAAFFNWFLIPIWGITGAAVASFISISLFNLIKHLIIVNKFGLQPYNLKFLMLILIASGVYWGSTFLPTLDFFVFDIAYRSSIVVLSFLVPVYFLKISFDINGIIDTILRKLKIMS